MAKYITHEKRNETELHNDCSHYFCYFHFNANFTQTRTVMEKEPRPKKINFIFGDQKIEGYRENTKGYLYHDDYSQYDNIFIQNIEPDSEPPGWVIFRSDLDNFDDVMEFMMDNGFTIEYAPEVSDIDKQIYDEREAGRQQKEEAQQVIEQLENTELTLRQERFVENHMGFLFYLMDNDKMDWNEEGEVYL